MLVRMNVLQHPLKAFLSRLSTEGKALNQQVHHENGQIRIVPLGSPVPGGPLSKTMALSYPSISKIS